MIVKVSTRGRITIPKYIREQLGISSGDDVDFFMEGDEILMVKRKKFPNGENAQRASSKRAKKN
jgi:AbrB family looped-hinge helix DNA binding protein